MILSVVNSFNFWVFYQHFQICWLLVTNKHNPCLQRKQTAKNVDEAVRELPDANMLTFDVDLLLEKNLFVLRKSFNKFRIMQNPEDLWMNHFKVVHPKPQEEDSPYWKAVQKDWSNLKHFRPVKPLGSGDTGSVHLVELCGTGIYFAMKAMGKGVMLNRNRVSEIASIVHGACSEREILDMVDHPFLPALYASFQVRKLIFYAADAVVAFTVKGEVQYFIGVQLDGSAKVDPLCNGITDIAAQESEQLMKQTAENADEAARELPDANMILDSGERIGQKHFRPVKPLGSGDTGSVHLVELYGAGLFFAMKAMDKGAMLNRNKVQRACAEREILDMVDHPFLPALYASFQTKTHICLITDYCLGGELFMLLNRQPMKVLKEDAVRFYAAEVVVALGNYIYRDLKPESVLLQANGHVALTDFDLSCLTSCKPECAPSVFSRPLYTFGGMPPKPKRGSSPGPSEETRVLEAKRVNEVPFNVRNSTPQDYKDCIEGFRSTNPSIKNNTLNEGWWEDNEKIQGLSMEFLDPPIHVKYSDLEIGKKRIKMEMGRPQLNRAVLHLNEHRRGKDTKPLREHILQIAQIISESIRFPPICDKIFKGYKAGTKLGEDLVDMQSDFGKESKNFTRNIFKEMAEENFTMTPNDYEIISVVKGITKVKYVKYGEGFTVDTLDVDTKRELKSKD
ncbi:hypothetical protein PTKIN_Ptkin03bG0025700 [Pterospermum kingtungense]